VHQDILENFWGHTISTPITMRKMMWFTFTDVTQSVISQGD